MAHTAANTTKKNPIIIEVFNADIVISATPITVKAISFQSAAAGDVFALQDGILVTSEVVFTIAQNVNGGSVSQYFGEKGYTFPCLYFDASEVQSGLSAGDRATIYLV
jgi:hypothetical protein